MPSGASYATARATAPFSPAWETWRGRLDEAEGYYRESLAIAVETDDAIGVADTWRILGVFLIAHERNRSEGEPFLRNAIHACQRFGMPDDAARTRATARTLGIDSDTLVFRT